MGREKTYHHSLEQHEDVYVPILADWSYHWEYRISRCLRIIYLIVSKSLLPSMLKHVPSLSRLASSSSKSSFCLS
jgi:hypothetical protein